MEGFLSFLSDLILFTAGIVVLLLWIVLLVGIAIETYDYFRGDRKADPEEEFIE